MALGDSHGDRLLPPHADPGRGKDQLLIWDPENLNSLDPDTGKPYWSRPLAPSYKMSIIAPRQAGDVLFASGIGYVGSAFKLGDKTPGAEPLWKVTRANSLCGANSTPLIVDGTLYGNCCEKGDLRALDLNTGEKLWETFNATTGSRRASHATVYLVRNGERWFLFNDSGDLIVARLSRKGYEERGRMHVLEATGEAFGRSVVWSHPAFAAKHMFARKRQGTGVRGPDGEVTPGLRIELNQSGVSLRRNAHVRTGVWPGSSLRAPGLLNTRLRWSSNPPMLKRRAGVRGVSDPNPSRLWASA